LEAEKIGKILIDVYKEGRLPPKLSVQDRLKLITRVVLNHEPVSQVCAESGISRTLFYRWLQRYKEEGNVAPLEKAKIKPQRVPEPFVLKIIEKVIKRPQWSSQRLSEGLERDHEGKPLVGNHGVQNVLQRLGLNTFEKREVFANEVRGLSAEEALEVLRGEAKVEGKALKPVLLPKELNPQQRLDMIERVVKFNEPVVKVCKDYQISRPTLYKWLKRYQKAAEEERVGVLVDKKPEVERYYRQTPEKYEEAILSVVAQYPDFGVARIVQALPQIAGESIVGHHGVQNVLQRHDLNTYEQRLAYAQTKITPITKFISVFEGLGTRFVILPAEARAKIIKFAGVSFLTAFITIVVFGFMGYMATIAGGVPMNARIGLGFASMALMVGSIFFAYSMKYYLTLALVLSFSRQTEEGGGLAIGLNGPSTSLRMNGNHKNGNGPSTGSGWLRRIFGLNGSLRGPTSLKSSTEVGPPQVSAGGLQPSLDHIQLTRYPFVSIHLPFYNEKKVAERILAACTSIDYPNFEIIVCDDSTDETVTIVQRFADQWNARFTSEVSRRRNTTSEVVGGPMIKILHRETREGFKGGALKEALKHMDPRTEFVIVFDADFIPYPDTIEQFLKYFKATGGWEEKESYQAGKLTSMPYETFSPVEISPQEQSAISHQQSAIIGKSNIACVAGYQWHVLNKSENWITRGVRTEYAGSYVIERPGQEILSALKIIHGSVYMIRADVLKHFGWGTSITEDFELTLRIYEKGFKVVYTPYVQAPSECVSTIKRLIRQRMRWSEGHSFNVRKMFLRLMLGYWQEKTDDRGRRADIEDGKQKTESNPSSVFGLQSLSSVFSHQSSKEWVPSPLTLMEKLELLYISPYYLQAAFFLIGTFSWLISETVFKARLPFWTSLWGWSLVLTNFFALPLVNAVGLFLEESEEKDYIGILSFVALSYLLVPFQAYASVKGFIEKQEGPWFRTPKSGLITDIFTRGRFYRWIAGILPGRGPASQPAYSLQSTVYSNSYLTLATANNQFNQFSIPKRRRLSWAAKATISLLLVATTTLLYFSRGVEVAYATKMAGPMKLALGVANAEFETWPTQANFLQNTTTYAASGQNLFYFDRTTCPMTSANYIWYTNLLPVTNYNSFIIPSGQYNLNIARTLGFPKNNWMNYAIQLILNNSDGSGQNVILDNTSYYLNNAVGTMRGNMNIVNTIYAHDIGIIGSNIAYNTPKQRLGIKIGVTASAHVSRSNITFIINNASLQAALVIPSEIEVPEIPKKVIFVILIGFMPAIPNLVSLTIQRKKKGKKGGLGQRGWGDEVKDLLEAITGRKDAILDQLPV